MADSESLSALSISLNSTNNGDLLVHTMYHGRMGGYKPELLRENIESELLCPLCEGLLNDPQETNCGHAFCSPCIDTYATQSSLAGKVVCPARGCQEELPTDVTRLKPGNVISKFARKKLLHCPFHTRGCDWRGPCDEVGSHVASCYQPEPTWDLVQGLASELGKLAAENTKLTKRMHALENRMESNDKPAFYWKIHHVKKAIQNNSELFSPTFMTGKCGYQACLHIYMAGNATGTNTHLSLYIQLQLGSNNDILPWPIRCSFKISILNFDSDEYHHTQRGNTEFDGTGKGVGFPKFISRLDLLRSEPHRRFVERDCLLIKCVLTPDSHIANLN